jgi:hypothetical protein
VYSIYINKKQYYINYICDSSKGEILLGDFAPTVYFPKDRFPNIFQRIFVHKPNSKISSQRPFIED